MDVRRRSRLNLNALLAAAEAAPPLAAVDVLAAALAERSERAWSRVGTGQPSGGTRRSSLRPANYCSALTTRVPEHPTLRISLTDSGDRLKCLRTHAVAAGRPDANGLDVARGNRPPNRRRRDADLYCALLDVQ